LSAVTDLAIESAAGDRLARRNAAVLAVAQALAGGNTTVIFATGGIVGATLAPERAMATLPLSTFVIGQWLGTVPVGWLAKTFGRRTAFLVGAACGVATGLIGAVAVLQGSFALFLLATFCGGLYAAAHMSYRFAAADTASDAFKPKAISFVLGGGLFAAFVGPQLVILTKDVWPPYLFAASYLAQAGVAVLAAVVLAFVKIPQPAASRPGSGGRGLIEIAGQSRFIVAVVSGAASYGLMNLVMTSAPLAMVDCNHSVTDATLGLQWHVLAMYAPSFVTGSLLARFGADRMIAFGLALIGAAAVVGLAGTSVGHFWAVLILLGVGWNFGFIGATTMVIRCHRPEERNKVQAFNDFLVFGSMAVSSFGSGQLLASFGWAGVSGVMLPVVLAIAALMLWLALRERPLRHDAA
jgi:MFS family permease